MVYYRNNYRNTYRSINNSQIKEIMINRSNTSDFKNFLKDFKEKYFENCYLNSTDGNEIKVFKNLYYPILERNSEDFIENLIRKKSFKSCMYNNSIGMEQNYVSHVIEFLDDKNEIKKNVLTFIMGNSMCAE